VCEPLDLFIERHAVLLCFPADSAERSDCTSFDSGADYSSRLLRVKRLS
jgi:hypothetical protein